jgi:hypothetical protein
MLWACWSQQIQRHPLLLLLLQYGFASLAPRSLLRRPLLQVPRRQRERSVQLPFSTDTKVVKVFSLYMDNWSGLLLYIYDEGKRNEMSPPASEECRQKLRRNKTLRRSPRSVLFQSRTRELVHQALLLLLYTYNKR